MASDAGKGRELLPLGNRHLRISDVYTGAIRTSQPRLRIYPRLGGFGARPHPWLRGDVCWQALWTRDTHAVRTAHERNGQPQGRQGPLGQIIPRLVSASASWHKIPIAKHGLIHYGVMAEVNAMTAKTAKIEMMQAHEAIAAALDAKIGHMPEWQAFRHLDRALLALEAEQPEDSPTLKIIPKPLRIRVRPNGVPPSYMSLADQALSETGKPIPTDKIVDYIAQHRPLSGDDPAKAKIVIQSSLSKDKRFKSVPWDGRRAWWYADKPIPK